MSLKLNYFETAANNFILITPYHLNINSQRKREMKDLKEIKINLKINRRQENKEKTQTSGCEHLGNTKQKGDRNSKNKENQ
jgi:hypothetical protein